MKVRRLSWAGVEIDTGKFRIMIDPMTATDPVEPVMGKPLWDPVPVPPYTPEKVVHALVTHNHSDHYDPQALDTALGPESIVYCPEAIVSQLKQDGFNAKGVVEWETIKLGGEQGLSVTAAPAVDWIGDAQVSWVVADKVHRIFHGGDTIWHGSWWAIAKKFECFDVAFLPVNGVVARIPGIIPSNLPGTLTPDQAVVAARLLNARVLCPMHYGQFSEPATYREHPDIIDTLELAARREDVALHLAKDGATVLE